MDLKTKKITDLPEATTIENLYTLGVDNANQSVKVPIELLKGNKGDKGDQGEVSKAELEAKADTTNAQGTIVRTADIGFTEGVSANKFDSRNVTPNKSLLGDSGEEASLNTTMVSNYIPTKQPHA